MYVLLEQSDVFIDAIAADQHAQLLFASAFGRDTSVQQFMARLHQPVKDGGVDSLTVLEHDGAKSRLRMLVGDPRRLEKVTGRLPRARLLGNIVHIWIFDPVLLSFDHATRSAWLFELTHHVCDEQLAAEAWRAIKQLSPVPLLDSWAPTVLAQVKACGGITEPPCLGAIRTKRIELSDGFDDWVAANVKDGGLPVASAAQASTFDRPTSA